MKPYLHLQIVECGESPIPILSMQFSVQQPHPYPQLSAPYRNEPLFFCIKGELTKLKTVTSFRKLLICGTGSLKIKKTTNVMRYQQYLR
ncbi:hypothetical protein AVDCRST_MAG81-2451 [uncultured Synechococcales cyanobacterium]|uniref:Uncharacterized protein n=1 Tax=uncultured Synechococcales cyanobacterium TaxID=1936017 RepID=A0A6J4VJ71_9CYAN|nr:hypothetical protein AVDCRST_MAG81-2451 [uncultured Synechococcales cyanobacterium]